MVPHTNHFWAPIRLEPKKGLPTCECRPKNLQDPNSAPPTSPLGFWKLSTSSVPVPRRCPGVHPGARDGPGGARRPGTTDWAPPVASLRSTVRAAQEGVHDETDPIRREALDASGGGAFGSVGPVSTKNVILGQPQCNPEGSWAAASLD